MFMSICHQEIPIFLHTELIFTYIFNQAYKTINNTYKRLLLLVITLLIPLNFSHWIFYNNHVPL